MKSYQGVKRALDLILCGTDISDKQLEVVQKISEMKEIKNIEVYLSQFPGMGGMRKNGWMWSEIEVCGAVEDERILNTYSNPPNGEGIVNFLKKYNLDEYIYYGPAQVIDGMNIDLCVGGIPDLDGETRDDIHYHINLELLTKKRFDELFKWKRNKRAKSTIYKFNTHRKLED